MEVSTDVINASTKYPLISSTFASTTHSAEAGDNAWMTVYISVSVIVVTALIIALTAYLVQRRYRRKKRRDTESYAVYNDIDSTARNRNSVPGMINPAYSSHTLEVQENMQFSNTEVTEQNVSLYTKINPGEIQPSTVPEKEDYEELKLYPQVILNDRDGYNHVRRPINELNATCYSHVTKTQDGFKVENDTSYLYMNNRAEESSQNFKKDNVDNSSTYSKTTLEMNPEAYTNILERFCDQDSTYDHAKAGGPDPEVREGNEYYHLNGVQKTENRDIIPRHGYENVVQAVNKCGFEDSHDCLVQNISETYNTDSKRVATDEYYNINDTNGSKDSAIAPRHGYVNVTREKEKSDNLVEAHVAGEYEEAIGHTPTYFVVQP